MNVLDVAKLKPTSRFFYWIKERHKIYLLREAGVPKPWTEDVILQNYFFTNPYRENDKTTVWFRENIREPLRDLPSVVMATVIFRWFNLIETGERLRINYGWVPGSKEAATSFLGFSPLCCWNKKKVVSLLSKVKEKGLPVFTGAYVIQSSKGSKIEVVCNRIQNLWDDRKYLVETIEKSNRLESVHNLLKNYPGLGGTGFMAYEIVCDLRYTYLLEDATDKLSWSNPGPGARRGINRILEKPLDSLVDLETWNKVSTKLLKASKTRLSHMPPFEMREIEHSLCEFDKYERLRLNEGKSKRRYKGTS